MRSRHSIGLAIASLAIALALPKFLSAQAPQTAAAPRTADVSSQGLDPATLLKPPVDSWPTYHGDYSGQRHSKLTQITPDNVHQLTLAWAWQSGLGGGIKSTPILVNGVLYITAPDNIWAIDARTARQIWRYTYPNTNQGFHIGHRGAAVYKDTVFLTTPDAHLIALDAKDGKVKWNVEIADWKKGFWSTNAPLVIRNHLIVGVSGDFDNLPGTLKSFDPETGKVAVDVLQHATDRHAWFDQRQLHWRPDVERRHVRSRSEPAVRRNRQPDARAERSVSSWRQPLDLQHPRAQPGYGYARLGLSSVASRHSRLGRGRSSCPRRRRLRRLSAQDAAAGVAQRLLLRARSYRTERAC